MDPKPGIKTTEVLALVAGLLAAVLPVVMDKIPPDSVWVAILGAVLAAATYIGGRSWVKAAASKARALESISQGKEPKGDPQ